MRKMFFSVCDTGGSEKKIWVLPTRSCCFAFQLLKPYVKALKSNKFELLKNMSLVPLTFLRTSHAGHAIARYLYYLPEFSPHYSGGGAQGTRPPLLSYFYTKLKPKLPKNFGWATPPPPPPPLSRSESGTALVHLEGNSILDIICSLVRVWTMWFTSIFYFLHFWIERRSRYVTLPWQQ